MNGEKQSLYPDVKNNFFQTHIWNYRTFLLVIILGAMLNNLEHSADLYMKISSKVNELQAYSVVIIFDLIVIALIGVGDSKAIIFAISVFFINELSWDGVTVFYQVYKKAWDVNYTVDESTQEYLALIEKGLTMLIYGSTFAFTVHHFSLLFKKQLSKHSKFIRLLADLRNRLAEVTSDNKVLSRELTESSKALANQEQKDQEVELLKQGIEKLSAENKELKNYQSAIEQQLTCTCGKKFDTLSQIFGHQRKCEVHKSIGKN